MENVFRATVGKIVESQKIDAPGKWKSVTLSDWWMPQNRRVYKARLWGMPHESLLPNRPGTMFYIDVILEPDNISAAAIECALINARLSLDMFIDDAEVRAKALTEMDESMARL